MTGAHAGIPTGVHVLLKRDGKVLMLRRAGTGFFDGLYSLPGGHVEPGESLRQTASRELIEETGLSVQPATLVYLGVVHRLSDTNRIDFFLQASSWVGYPEICEPDKCDALAWIDTRALPGEIVPYVRCALEQESVPWVLEFGWPADDMR